MRPEYEGAGEEALETHLEGDGSAGPSAASAKVSETARGTIRRMLTRRRVLLAAVAAVAGCAVPQGQSPLDAFRPLYARPSANDWPDEFWQASPEVQDAYRYAVANREVLQYMPCFCGCVAVGHQSNFNCYVREVLPEGRLRLDGMSFG